jgi:hypothetical protein
MTLDNVLQVATAKPDLFNHYHVLQAHIAPPQCYFQYSSAHLALQEKFVQSMVLAAFLKCKIALLAITVRLVEQLHPIL